MWKIEDILDLVYLRQIDTLSEDELHQRDRDIYLHAKKSNVPHSSHLERLNLWLNARRSTLRKTTGTRLHSSAAGKSIYTLNVLLFTIGLILGVGSGLSYFVYTGTTPLNVFAFFTIFILPQLFLITLFLCKSVIVKFAQKPLSSATTILFPLFTNFIVSISRKYFDKSKGTARDLTRHMLNVKENPILFYSLFLGTQLFGVALNLGLIAITVFKVTTSDLAFGWQTTLQLGAEKLHTLIKIMALPWTWLLPKDIAYPSLEAIEGTRIILKEGIYNLATENLISWWPFLLLSLVIYGLLPRLVLALGAVLLKKWVTSRYLNTPRFLRITARMQTPVVSTQAAPPNQSNNFTDTDLPSHPFQEAGPHTPISAVSLLIPADLDPMPNPKILEYYLQSQGYIIKKTLPIFQNYDSDQKLLRSLSSLEGPIIVVIEAWMAPITEQLNFIESIYEMKKSPFPTGILFLGKPITAESIEPPLQRDVMLWQERIAHKSRDMLYFIPQQNVEYNQP